MRGDLAFVAMSDHDVLGELACYLLAGAPDDPQVLFDDVAEAERIGLGTGFISERFNVKEAATLSGAVAASSTDLGIATGVTNHNTRHLMVTASFATTMDRLTGGRFALGLGRGVGVLFDAFGIPHITTAQLEDVATLLRRVWSGSWCSATTGRPVGTRSCTWTGGAPSPSRSS